MPKCSCAPLCGTTEGSPRAAVNTLLVVCPACGDTMEHNRTIPKLGIRPELLIFVCPYCKETEAMNMRRIASGPIQSGH